VGFLAGAQSFISVKWRHLGPILCTWWLGAGDAGSRYCTVLTWGPEPGGTGYWIAWHPELGLSACSGVGNTQVEALGCLAHVRSEVLQVLREQSVDLVPLPAQFPEIPSGRGSDVAEYQCLMDETSQLCASHAQPSRGTTRGAQ